MLQKLVAMHLPDQALITEEQVLTQIKLEVVMGDGLKQAQKREASPVEITAETMAQNPVTIPTCLIPIAL